MAIESINKNLLELGKRVYNGKMLDGKEKTLSDEEVLKELVSKAFNTGSNTINNIQAYKDLNSLIITTADVTVQPRLQQIISLVADYRKVNLNDFVRYDVNDIRTRVNSAYTATGTGVDFTRIPKHKKVVIATPRKHQFGVKYSIQDMVNDTINAFNTAVDFVVEEKIRYTVSQIFNLARTAATNSKIPTKQTFEGAGITLPQYRTVESSLLRRGNNIRPVVIGDLAMITALAEAQATQVAVSNLSIPMFLTDELRQSLLRDITFEQISKSIAINLDNPYIDTNNSVVDLPVNEALVIAGGSDSPFRITDYGDMAVLSDEIDDNIETEEVHIKVSYKVDITLLLGQNLGYLKDTSVSL